MNGADMSASQFCDECGVTLDLHDGGDEAACRNAGRKADLLDSFFGFDSR